MKLWHSFLKELKLASTSFYFYIELAMAIILLIIVTMMIPENFESKSDEYLYLDLEGQTILVEEYGVEVPADEAMMKLITDDGELEPISEVVKIDGEEVEITLYESEDRRFYITNTEEEMIELAKDEKVIGAKVSVVDNGFYYDYYLQGYESEKFKNILTAFHVIDPEVGTAKFDLIETRSLGATEHDLNSRENIIPVFLYFNGSLMGLFIIASYIFLDKGEGIIKAYAITASKVWIYLMSKIGVLTVTSILTSLIIVVPVMGLDANYLALLVLLITSGFMISVVGLILSSYYTNVMQSFGVLYVLIIILSLPAIAYNVPSWEPIWVKIIPTYHMIEGFKETLVTNGDIGYVYLSSLMFLVIGGLLFFVANYRFKKTLTVGG